MSWQTNPFIVAVRTVVRKTGLNRVLVGRQGKYEERFHDAMFSQIRAGDVVWDVGANVGLYTREFMQKVGPSGSVVAIEPSASNRSRLLYAVGQMPNVKLLAIALSSTEGFAAFVDGADELGATSHIAAAATGEASSTVALRTGDLLIAGGEAPKPNFIKIDTEGHELEVLRGLAATLKNPDLRAVCLEVHFGVLAASGRAAVPAEIERMLQQSGFHLRWTDPSHLVATRAA